MIKFNILLPDYKWKVNIYIAVHQYHKDEILDKMRSLGASDNNINDAYINLSSGQLNTGLTFTNPQKRESVLVIALTSSSREFMNSFTHEIRHLEQHIANACGIDENSEEACYLSGDLAYRMFPFCKDFLCECCRNKHNSILH